MDTEDQTLANTDNFSTSPVRDEYAPVIFSQKTVSHIVSIDLMSGKEDRETILRARASGKGALTSPFKLLKSNHLGVVLTFAVYNIDLPPDATPAERINATVGYLGASYDVPSLVEKLLHQLASKQTINVNVYDTTSPEAPIKMYGADVADNGLHHISHLDFGDPARKYEMHCRFKHEPLPLWQAILVSVGLLVINLLVGRIFHVTIKKEHDFNFICQLDYLQTAYDSGQVLISLINKVLDQAKIESGRHELEAVSFDPRAVHDSVANMKPDQKDIYHIAADSVASARNTPFLEKLTEKDIEPESPTQLGGKIYEMMNMALLGKWGGAASAGGRVSAAATSARPGDDRS